jgi:hypothetical protein
MSADRAPFSRGITRLADIPDGERRDGGPELVIRGEHPVITMPVLPRRRREVSEPIEELKWGKLDDAAGARPRGLPPAPWANPVGCLVSREHIADAGDAAVFGAEMAYFLAAGFVLSCFGFMLFLSFFCELLPLPMVLLPRLRDWIRLCASLPDHSIGRNCRRVQFTGWDFSSAARFYSCSPSP